MAKIASFRGKPIAELSRAEFTEALEWACAKIEEYHSPDNCKARALGRVEMLRRGKGKVA